MIHFPYGQEGTRARPDGDCTFDERVPVAIFVMAGNTPSK